MLDQQPPPGPRPASRRPQCRRIRHRDHRAAAARPAANAAPDSIRAASAGSGTIATSSSSSVQIPPSAEHQRGHDRVGADGDDQLDPGWSHPLGEHTAVVRRRRVRPAGGRRPAPRRPSAARARRHRARTCAARHAELSFSATSPPSSSSAATASSSPDTTRPPGTATPWARSSSLASCSASHRPSPRAHTVRAERGNRSQRDRDRPSSRSARRRSASRSAARPRRRRRRARTPTRHSSSSSSGSVDETSVGTGLRAAPAMMPSRTARHDSSEAPVRPYGWS